MVFIDCIFNEPFNRPMTTHTLEYSHFLAIASLFSFSKMSHRFNMILIIWAIWNILKEEANDTQ